MDYQQTLAYIEQVQSFGISLGLAGMKALLAQLGNPQQDLPVIHIAGTNGKGSLLAYTSTILTEAGYQVGRYISPTLFSYRERIQLNGEAISEEDLAAGMTRIKAGADAMAAEGLAHPTIFEIETALCFWYFKRMGCDMVVLETGLGGELDATNVIEAPVCTAITPISLDHMGILGKDLATIAAAKAGIIKTGRPVISGLQEEAALNVIKKKCGEKQARLWIVTADDIGSWGKVGDGQTFSYKNRTGLQISLKGRHQIENACIAIEIVDELRRQGYPIKEEALEAGLKKTSWPGRFETICREPEIIIDGAHNIAGARAFADCLDYYFTNKRIIYIMGILKDKDYEGVVKLTAKKAEYIFTITPDNARGLEAGELAEVIKAENENVEAAPSLLAALNGAREKAGKDGIVAAFGSLSFLGELKMLVQQ